ncbi:MAG: cyclase family protein [Bacteroidota bacterium]|jgi:kynurenine formamidase
MNNFDLHTSVVIGDKTYKANLLEPIDISIPLRSGPNNIHAWYVGDAEFKAVENENWIGDVNRGGAVNFRDIYFNPHGHGTHTECVGHISKEDYTINQCLKQFFFPAQVVTITPENREQDQVITAKQISNIQWSDNVQALIIRTLPNNTSKLNRQYSSSNPPYIDAEAVQLIIQAGINHLLVDLPSIDKEHDEGKLAGHHVFWNYPESAALHRTITEFVFVPNEVIDGLYLLNLQISPFENDAAPSKPVLFKLV